MSCHPECRRNGHHYQPGGVIDGTGYGWDEQEEFVGKALGRLEVALTEFH